MTTEHRGSCLCGNVRFTVRGELPPVQICHCSQCRQAQGGPFATKIPVAVAALTFERGEDLLRFYESSPGKERAFCSVWGSPVFSRRGAIPDTVRLRAGLLQEPVALSLGFHAHMDSRAGWWPVDDRLPAFPGAAPAGVGAPSAPDDR